MKAALEQLSGLSLDQVKVHRNSARPAELSARARTQGSDIPLAPGQAKSVSHESWHVTQLKTPSKRRAATKRSRRAK